MATEKEKEQKLHVEAVKQMIALATSGFGLVAALAWNNLIQDIVNNYLNKVFPKGSSIVSLFIYAVVITVLAVLVTLQLSKLAQHLENK